MNTPSNAVPDSPLDSQQIAPATLSATRPLYWSIRRELWENRSIYIGPLAAAGVFLFGFFLSLIALPHRMRALGLDPARQRVMIQKPYEIAAGLIIGTALIVALFYCLEALHGERRDRSILFWKSLPVSDLTTVLSKASIPLVIVPLLAFAILVATQLIMAVLSSVVLLGSGVRVPMLSIQLLLSQTSLMLLYHLLTVHVLWQAPIYGWLLLVSAWARRAAFLWAVLPVAAVCVVEKLAFNTSHLASLLHNRFSGPEAFGFPAPDSPPMNPLMHLAPGKFLSAPGLWIGLVVTAAFLVGAARLRRYQGPI